MGLNREKTEIASQNVKDSHGSHILYTERLYPSAWIWVISVLFSSTAFLIFVPISRLAGLIATILLCVLLALFWLSTTPRITITDRTLQAGKAAIDRRYLGVATGFHGQDATKERGVNLHGNAYLLLRGWIDPVVKVEVLDDTDPHPYWLLSTRNPEAIVRALGD